MATAYSTLLGLALPVQGELSGTWGDTVNNYITTYLDAAVAGAQSLTTDADVTLTKTTGTALGSTSAQYAILNCTGARTALRTINAPSASKIYVILNATTGGFGVKIVGAGPTTGVTVAAGTKALVAWNGSDFAFVSSTDIAQLTGTLGVANGGSGAATFTANNVLLGNGTSAFQTVAPSTSGNLLTSNGTTWVSSAPPSSIPSGTVMLFVQSSAPSGWTKSTTHDNKALRVVSGTASSGGTVAFTTAFASQAVSGTVGNGTLAVGATTLATTQIPSHTHGLPVTTGYSSTATYQVGTLNQQVTNSLNSGAAGGGGSHTHSISGAASFTGTAINLAVQYVDVIIATKD
jgi:hypothetical protein